MEWNYFSLLFLVFLNVSLGGKDREDWSSLNIDILEEEWKKGDDIEELKTPDDELFEAYEYHRKRAISRLQNEKSGVDKLDNDEMNEIQNAHRPALIFVTMKQDAKQSNRSWNSLASVCETWGVRYTLTLKCLQSNT